MAKTTTPWTADDDRYLLQLRAVGLTWREIAQLLQRSHAACEGRWHTKLKLKADG
jgi:hypothetical protein